MNRSLLYLYLGLSTVNVISLQFFVAVLCFYTRLLIVKPLLFNYTSEGLSMRVCRCLYETLLLLPFGLLDFRKYES